MNRKTITEKEMSEQLRRGTISLPPLRIRLLKNNIIPGLNQRFKAIIELSWHQNIVRCAVEYKSLYTPKAFRDGLNFLKLLMLPRGYEPLLFMPFLSEEHLLDLEREGISGIDLCGNCVVIVPGMLAIFRSGGENRFSTSAPIKNIYRKNSSMVGRVFLLKYRYDGVQEICAEVNRRNILINKWNKKPMSLATVSKSLKTLEQDLIIQRNKTIQLIQPDKLLEKLSRNYNSPTITGQVRIKISEGRAGIQKLLLNYSKELNIPIVATGLSSVDKFAVMKREELLSVYCPHMDTLLERIQGSISDRFPNLEIIETNDEPVYFDAWQEGDFRWASPIQVYLELMMGDRRDRETAEQMKSDILKNFSARQ